LQPHPHKTKIVNGWKIITSKPLGPIIMIGQPETKNSSQIILIIAFFSHWCTTLLPQQIVPKFWAKTILWGQHKVSGLNFRLEQQTDHCKRYPQVCTYG